MSNRCEIRAYRPGDEHGIVRLFSRTFDREMSLEEWRWKYTGRLSDRVYAVVAVTDSQEVVGHYGGILQRMVHDGNEVRGLAVVDVMLDPAFRGIRQFKELARFLPEMALPDGIALGYGFPSRWVMLLPERLGLYEKVEDVIEARKVARRRMSRPGRRLLPLEPDDARIDDLWESVKADIGLAVVRDREHLDWRYARNPLLRYEIRGLEARWSGRLEGIAVLRREADALLLVDLVCAKDDLGLLVRKVEGHAAASGASSLKLFAPGHLSARLARLGFQCEDSGICIPRTTHEGFLSKREMEGSFFFTMGDTDYL